jgi:hypothetical protein
LPVTASGLAQLRVGLCVGKLRQTRVTSSRECLAQMLNQETKEKFNKNRREGKKYVLLLRKKKVISG